MHHFDLKSYLNLKTSVINQELAKWIQERSDSSRLLKAMNYSLMAGGKRIRPVLCLAAAEAISDDIVHVLPAACALEMIHTYSLIHDDLPSMDNDDLRRGKPTCHIAFDEATALLAGDALLTMAFEILASPDAVEGGIRKPETITRVIQLTALAAGCRGMIEGQMLDMASEGIVIPLDQLEHLHLLKTGALIKASVRVGAMMAGGTDGQIHQLTRYAESIGLAFQVADDILNVEGDALIMGKAVGTDSARKKSTYPSLIGVEASRALAKKLVNNALKAIAEFDNKSDPLRAIAEYVIERDN